MRASSTSRRSSRWLPPMISPIPGASTSIAATFPERELRTDDGGYRRPWPNPALMFSKPTIKKGVNYRSFPHHDPLKQMSETNNCACNGNGNGENCFRKDAHFVARNLLSAMAER